MYAAIYRRHGDAASVLETVITNRPIPTAGQVLLKVHSASLNPVDIKLIENNLPRQFIPLPKIPGADVYGTIVSTDQCDNCPYDVGDRVICMLPLLYSVYGALAQYVAVDIDLVARVSPDMESTSLASLPLVGLTVLQALHFDTLPMVSYPIPFYENKKILIQGGSGGLGTFAVQYCKNVLKMYVIATCSSHNVQYVRSLGADEVIDYNLDKFENSVRDVDIVLDPYSYLYEERTLGNTSGHEYHRPSVIRPHKDSQYIKIASSPYTDANTDMFHLSIPEASPVKLMSDVAKVSRRHLFRAFGHTVPTYKVVFVHPNGLQLRDIISNVSQGRIKPCVTTRRFQLMTGLQEAFSSLRTGHVQGKIIIDIP